MAGIGPPPNPNARRQNKRTDGFTELPARNENPAPPLPGEGWSDVTLEAWRAWWESPQSTQWHASDLPSLYLMASLFESAITGTVSAMTEFRQLSDRFGLSPMARLRNRWLVSDPDAQAAAERVEGQVGNVVKLRKSS